MAKIKLKKPNLKIKKPTKTGIIKAVKSTKFLVSMMVILALGGFGYSGYYWWVNNFMDKNDIFYGMLDKSLNTSSVLRTVKQKDSGRTEQQSVYLRYAPGVVFNSKSSLEQVDQNRNLSKVSTESFANKNGDYIRYTDISISNTPNDQADYTKLLNTWAKRSDNTNEGSQFLNEAAFTFVPFGNFSDEIRAGMIAKLREKNVYELSSEKIVFENGRPIYTALASISPRSFVDVMRDYAKETGIGNLDQLDPDQYDPKNSFTIQIKIDVISRHLKQIDYPTGDRSEIYEAYGLFREVNEPKSYISIEELQSRLQQNNQ